MTDYYQDGFDDGYGRHRSGEREYPQNDGDDYNYRKGVEDGQRRRRVMDEPDDEEL